MGRNDVAAEVDPVGFLERGYSTDKARLRVEFDLQAEQDECLGA
jgi:hypothetical protein